jgi:hypothetical protein
MRIEWFDLHAHLVKQRTIFNHIRYGYADIPMSVKAMETEPSSSLPPFRDEDLPMGSRSAGIAIGENMKKSSTIYTAATRLRSASDRL